MVEQDGVPTGRPNSYVDAIRAAITHEWHYRIQHQISASPGAHIEAMVQAVSIALSAQKSRPRGLCGVKAEHFPHVVHTGSLAPFFCTADQSQREPGRSERRRLENRKHLDLESLSPDYLDQ